MLEETQQLKSKFKLDDKQHNFAECADAYCGKDAVVLSCGPSIKSIDLNTLKEWSEGKLVVCLKQSYNLARGWCDIHHNSFVNFQDYNYIGNPIRVLQWWFPQHKRDNEQAFIDSDIILKIRPHDPSISVLSASLNNEQFNKMYLLNRDSGSIRVGPGMIYETGFSFLRYIGVKKITTFGWDLSVGKTDKSWHFYSGEDDDNNTVTYKSGVFGEVPHALRAIPKISNFLKTSGITVDIVSDTSPVKADDTFNKIGLDEWYNR